MPSPSPETPGSTNGVRPANETKGPLFWAFSCSVAGRALSRYRTATHREHGSSGKPLGVTGEVAELEAAERLRLRLTDARTPYYDAVNVNGERFQVKGRAVRAADRYRGRMSAVKCDGDYEWVLLVLLDIATCEVLEIWQADREAVAARLQAPSSKSRNERNSLGITQFKSIAKKVWPNV
jgi:hypothetical protein